MVSATVAVVGLADAVDANVVAQLESPPTAILRGGAVLAFTTPSTAAQALQELRIRHPFIRGALDVTEVDLDSKGDPVLAELDTVSQLLQWASAAPSGELLVTDVARQLLRRNETVLCRQHDSVAGLYRLTAVSRAIPPLPLPRLLAGADRHPFVNRYTPWLALERAWASTCVGERRVILLEGEAGSGKTRLATEFARRAGSVGGMVVYGGSTESLEVPFQPFSEALRPLFEALLDGSLSAGLDPTACADLALLFPWADVAATRNASRDQVWREPEADRHWAFEAVVHLLAAATQVAPVLVVLDDLHWAQRPTVRLLEHVLRSDRLERLCVVATARDEPSDRTEAFLTSVGLWSRLPGVERVGVDPFDEVGIRRFVANATGTLVETLPAPLEPVVHQLVERTGGNAFLLAELWQQLIATNRVHRVDEGWVVGSATTSSTPRSVREMVDQRMARLGSSSRLMLELAATIGESFEVRLLAAAGRVEVAEVLDLVAQGVAFGLLREASLTQAAFVHALVRQSIESSQNSGDRARHHLAVAHALLDTGRAEAALLARHFAAAIPLEPPATAARYARQAAQDSIETVAFDDAITVLREVEQVVDDDGTRADILIDLAVAYARSGDAAAALRCASAAARLARNRNDQECLIRAAKAMYEATWRGTLPGTSAATLLAESLNGDVGVTARCELLAALSGALALNGEEAGSRRAGDEAIALAETLPEPRLLLDAIHSRLIATVGPESVADQIDLCQRGIDVARRVGDEVSELKLQCKLMLRLFVRFDATRFTESRARFNALSARFRQPFYLLFQSGSEAAVALSEGRFIEAEAAAERCREWSEVNHQGDGSYGVQMFSIRREQGRLGELRPLLELAARLRRDDTSWAPGLAVLYAEIGMLPDAEALLDRLATDNLASVATDSLMPGVMSYLADAAFLCGHQGVARLTLERLAPYSGLGIYVPGLACYGAADRYLGRIHSTLGDHEAALEAFEAALALDTTTGWSTWIAHSSYALAAQLATTPGGGERRRARALLANARAITESLGMTALGGRAAALDKILHGEEPENEHELTTREREVLRLLSQGLSNRQIGGELNVSQHTVANHVRAILAKIGAANRTQAAAWAHRHGESA